MSSSLFLCYEWRYFSRLKIPLPLLSRFFIFSYRDKLPRSLLQTASPNLYLVKYKSHLKKYSLYPTKYRLCLMLWNSLP